MYDFDMTGTPHGRRLYAYWRKIRKEGIDPRWNEYPAFFNWAMTDGKYEAGAKLIRRDDSKPYSPENVIFEYRNLPDPDAEKQIIVNPCRKVWAQKWDETVNRIRRHYGYEPIRSAEIYYE